MKLSSKLSALVLGLALLGGMATADARGHDRDRSHDRGQCHHINVSDLATTLKLSAAQREQMEKMMDKHRAAMDKLRDAHEKEHEQERADLKKLWDSQRADMATVLNPTQLAEFDKMQKERHRRHPPMGMMGDMPPADADKPASSSN